MATEHDDADVAILGIPFDGASSFRKGAAEAPAAIRSLTPHTAPFTEEGSPLGALRIRDLGDLPCEGDWQTISGGIKAGARRAFSSSFAVFLGGDHSVTIPVIETLSEREEGTIGVCTWMHILIS